MEKLTLKKIIDYAEKHGKKYECYSTFKNRWGNHETAISYIGISFRSGVWYWFKQYPDPATDYLFFDHRYSQNNGKTIRSFMQGFRAELKILKSA